MVRMVDIGMMKMEIMMVMVQITVERWWLVMSRMMVTTTTMISTAEMMNIRKIRMVMMNNDFHTPSQPTILVRS